MDVERYGISHNPIQQHLCCRGTKHVREGLVYIGYVDMITQNCTSLHKLSGLVTTNSC